MQAILQRLREHGRVVAAELTERFAVAEESIRRDLRELAAQGCAGGSTVGRCRQRRRPRRCRSARPSMPSASARWRWPRSRWRWSSPGGAS
ncbi:putative DNA-binding transcriptional regulator YafY [Xanthomonas sp. F4]